MLQKILKNPQKATNFHHKIQTHPKKRHNLETLPSLPKFLSKSKKKIERN
jgi:hypothetical protein